MYKSKLALKPGYWIRNGKAEKEPVDIIRNGINGVKYCDGTEILFPGQTNFFKPGITPEQFRKERFDAETLRREKTGYRTNKPIDTSYRDFNDRIISDKKLNERWLNQQGIYLDHRTEI